MSITGTPRLLLRLEGASVLAASAWLYALSDTGWLLFALLFLAPDVAMLGYLGGPRLGAALYNAAHTYALPALLAAAGALAGAPILVALALVGTAHIGLDRMLGYGLKYPTRFGDTHLGPIGRPPEAADGRPVASADVRPDVLGGER